MSQSSTYSCLMPSWKMTGALSRVSRYLGKLSEMDFRGANSLCIVVSSLTLSDIW